MELQLKKDNIPSAYLKDIDLAWAKRDLSSLIKKFTNRDYILIFPFCSKKNIEKKWPYYKNLISQIMRAYKNRYSVLIAPGPNEIDESKKINATCILDNGKALDITQLSSLIKNSSFVVANDTGPAHMAAHLDAKGLALYGSHTSAFLQSIERDNFKVIQVSDLKKLSAEKVFLRLSDLFTIN